VVTLPLAFRPTFGHCRWIFDIGAPRSQLRVQPGFWFDLSYAVSHTRLLCRRFAYLWGIGTSAALQTGRSRGV